MYPNTLRKVLFILLLTVFIAGCREKQAPAEVIITDVAVLEASEYDNLKRANLGKTLVVNVFATWCPPCEVETPGFVRVYNELGGDSFELIALSIDARKSAIISFVNFYGIRYPVYQIKRDLQRRLYADKVPTTIIYRPDGALYRTFLGAINEEYLIQIINSLKDGK